MSEATKTITFVALAVISLFVAFLPMANNNDFDIQTEVGKVLNQFDVDDAKRLRIVTFDQETASTRDFEVSEEDGLWTIPSKQGYPADAVEQMAKAATCMIDREVLRIAAENASQHVELGLVDPTSSNLDIETAGVGTRVTMTNIDGESLADMVIGKEVPESEGQRYVRNADQDVAYVVNLSTDALTTRFEDWIEKDLLNLNPLDVRQVHIKDESAEFQPVLTPSGIQLQANWDRRGDLSLRYDDTDSKWVPERLQKFDPAKKEMIDYTLGEEQQLNEDALRELRSGLDDLSIVDVERKPAGLSANLKAGSDFVKNQEEQSSLITRGFAPMPSQDGGDMDILSSEGEITCTLENGVEYVLRFGNLQMQTDDDATSPDSQADGNEQEADDGIHRYLFVMARFNEGAVEKPQLTDLPDLPEGLDESALEDAEEDQPAEDDSTDTTEDNTTSTEEPKVEEEEEEEEIEEETSSEVDADDDADVAETELAVAETEEAEAEGTETTSGETEAAESDEGEVTAETEETQENDLSNLIAQRKAIEAENNRLLEEYQQKLADARRTVKDLNERFGDWYYVIDNKVYKQIHLSREDVIQAKEGEASDAEAPPAPGISLPGLPNLPVGS
jgi:hypothetical protein